MNKKEKNTYSITYNTTHQGGKTIDFGDGSIEVADVWKVMKKTQKLKDFVGWDYISQLTVDHIAKIMKKRDLLAEVEKL